MPRWLSVVTTALSHTVLLVCVSFLVNRTSIDLYVCMACLSGPAPTSPITRQLPVILQYPLQIIAFCSAIMMQRQSGSPQKLYKYRTSILRWLPSKLAEWIGDNMRAELQIAAMTQAKCSRASKRGDACWHPLLAAYKNMSQPWCTQNQGWKRAWLKEIRSVTHRTTDEVSQLCQAGSEAAAKRRLQETIGLFWSGGEPLWHLHPALPTLHALALRTHLPNTS